MSDVIQSLLDETFALQHYGVKGQKWGHRNYQNPDGTYTELGKERRRVGYTKNAVDSDEDSAIKISGKAYKDMTRRERRAAKRKARHNEAERRERREFNRDKNEAIQRADLDFIDKHIDKFTNDEIMQAVDRYKRMQLIKDFKKAEKAEKDAKVERLIDKGLRYLKRASDAADSISNISNKITQTQKNKVDLEKSRKDLEKTQHELDKLINPEKYEKKKTQAEINAEKLALEKSVNEFQLEKDRLEKSKEELRKKKSEAEKAENEARKAKYDADKNDPETIKRVAKEKEEEVRRKAAEAEAKRKEAEEAERKAREDSERVKEAKEAAEKAEKEFKEYLAEREKAEKEAEELYKKQKEEYKKWRDEENQKYYDDFMDKYNQANYYSPFYGSAKERSSLIKKILGSDKLKDYESYKPSKNRTYELEDLNKESRNAIKKIAKEKPQIGDYAQDKQWTKDMKKHDSRYIDKWVDDMKKKYMKERNMSAKAAEAKAEEYVDAWIDAYDEGRILV